MVGLEFLDFCVIFLLSEIEWHIKYVFNPLMDVIKIFGGVGVWTFINFIHWMILNDNCERLFDGLIRWLYSPWDVDVDSFLEMFLLTNIFILLLFLNCIFKWYRLIIVSAWCQASLWEIDDRPHLMFCIVIYIDHCERSMA